MVDSHTVLIPSWLGWVLEQCRRAVLSPMTGLNPFLVRVGVGTNKSRRGAVAVRLNPFLVRVGVGTSKCIHFVTSCVLIPSWLGWVLEQLTTGKINSRLGLNPFLVRVGVGTADQFSFDRGELS